MEMKNVLIGIVVVLLLILAVIIGFVLLSGGETLIQDHSPTTFSVIETGTAAQYGYAVFNYRGSGNITMVSYPTAPKRNVVIINDTQAVDADRLPELVGELQPLEQYGFNVSVTSEPKIGDDIYIVPTGAIPSYALFNLESNSSHGEIIYIGGKDLLLSSGIKQLGWYGSLSEEQKARVVQFNGTLNEFLDKSNVSLAQLILRNDWMAYNSSNMSVSGSSVKSTVVPLNGSGFFRIIYDFQDLHGIYDSPYLQTAPQYIAPSPQLRFPWEKSTLQFSLNATNGTAFLSVKKDGKVVEHEQLMRVTDQNVFIKKLEYNDPGDYVITVNDNSGTIASGLLQVRDIEINLASQQGVTYVFSVTVDGSPMTDSEVMVSLGNSSAKKFFVSGGQVVVPAKLDQGKNTFYFDVSGSTIPVVVDNEGDTVLGFYIKYGLPGLVIVAVVYFGARMTRRPTYSLRFGDSASYIRQEITLPLDRALESFQMIRRDMKIGRAPITPQEFTISLKRYLTNGADVTEGNVEEILKKLVKAGYLESHRDYYQLRGEGEVKRNTLSRMVREKLIESGTPFSEKEGKFVTKDYEIGFFGDKFSGKAVIVVDDKSEEKGILSSMSRSESARYLVMQANDMLSFVTIDRLSEML
jgi:hypothetical protein